MFFCGHHYFSIITNIASLYFHFSCFCHYYQYPLYFFVSFRNHHWFYFLETIFFRMKIFFLLHFNLIGYFFIFVFFLSLFCSIYCVQMIVLCLLEMFIYYFAYMNFIIVEVFVSIVYTTITFPIAFIYIYIFFGFDYLCSLFFHIFTLFTISLSQFFIHF